MQDMSSQLYTFLLWSVPPSAGLPPLSHRKARGIIVEISPAAGLWGKERADCMDDILIVEDDRPLSQGIRLEPGGRGAEVYPDVHPGPGERALEERPFSLVVLDLNLPGRQRPGAAPPPAGPLRSACAHSHRQRLGAGPGHRSGAGGGRLCDQALLPGGPACPGKQPAAPRPLPQNRAGAAPLPLTSRR